MKAVPNQNPFVTVLVVCPLCSQVVLPTFSKMNSGEISDITYYHVNEAVGCAWKLVDPKERSRGENLGLKNQVRAGVDSKGQPAFVDEHDLAKGKSFDIEGLKPHVPSPLNGNQMLLPSESHLGLNNTMEGASPKPTPKFVPTPKTDEPDPVAVIAGEGEPTAESDSETEEVGGLTAQE